MRLISSPLWATLANFCPSLCAIVPAILDTHDTRRGNVEGFDIDTKRAKQVGPVASTSADLDYRPKGRYSIERFHRRYSPRVFLTPPVALFKGALVRAISDALTKTLIVDATTITGLEEFEVFDLQSTVRHLEYLSGVGAFSRYASE